MKVTDATPDAFVTAVLPAGNVPLAPVGGAVNVTVRPDTGLPLASVTVADSGAVKVVLICAVWGVPPVAVILAGVICVLVSVNVAGVDRPLTDAVTT